MNSGRLYLALGKLKQSLFSLQHWKQAPQDQYFYAAINSNNLVSYFFFDFAKLQKMANISNILEDVRANTNGNETVDSNYILIDIGANLTNKKFSRDVDAVVQRAKESGVQKIMVKIINKKEY